MATVWRSIGNEPRPADVPPVGRWDGLLIGGYTAAVAAEGITRPDVEWRPLVMVVALGLAPLLAWRRTSPLAVALLGWGLAGLLAVLQLTLDTGNLGLNSMGAVVITLFSLVRWGSGKEMLAGTAFVTVVAVLGFLASAAGWADVVGGGALLLLVIALAAVFRSRADLRHRHQREIRNQERMELARELHDTVAHHISAIAIQAQAGGVVLPTAPDRAAAALTAIESEAARAMAEMRSMVRVLRDEDAVDYSPQQGVADLPTLSHVDTTAVIRVSVDESLTRLAHRVDAALFRIAQESVTNAVRHARNATRIEIDVRRDGETVRLRVSDDGADVSGADARLGFGLLGMAERTHLLGGAFSAGAGATGGWVVEAVFPMATRS